MSSRYRMMMKITVVLLLAALVRCDDYDEEPKKISCEDRCLRIHERSLDRIGFSKINADRYIDKQKSDEKTMREVCWKQYDYFYCMKGCTKSVEHEKYARHVKSRCKPAVEDLESGLTCLFKYRSFLEIRCSSFLNEAIRLKQADEPDLLPDKETCRYLHLNALCLENSVGSFCPQATTFFRRLNLRDFFLNHILPADDELFDDEDLDSCQMKDFVKEALEGVKVSPRRMDEEDETTTPSHHSSTSPSSTNVSYENDDDDEDDKDDSEESWPSTSTTSPPPAIVRTLSPSTRGHPSLQTSTTSNFVYTTPTRKQVSSTFAGTSSTQTPIHITKEQAMRTSTARAGGGGEGRGQRITVTPKTHTTTTTTKTTTGDPSTTTSKRRLFDSDEDFTQTPPNFLWGSFRGENYKLARNYSESFPHDAQFVTPVTVESSSLFGDDDDGDSRDDDIDDYGDTQVIDMDREVEPVTVTGRPVKTTTVVRLDEKRKDTTKRVDEDHSSQVYEHAVDTQLQPTTLSRPLPLEPAEGTTILWKPEPTTESRVLPTDSDVEDEDENEIRGIKEEKEDEMEEEDEEDRNRSDFDPATHGFAIVDDVDSEEVEIKDAENNFDRAIQLEKEVDDDSNEIQTSAADEQLKLIPMFTTTPIPEAFTPLINGGRVAVKSIKQFRAIGEEESAQDWTEDPNVDDSHVDIGDVDDYDKEVYLTSEMLPDESRDSEIRRRINFILAYTSLFFILLLLVVCCIIVVIVKNRRNAQMDDRPYKMHSDL